VLLGSSSSSLDLTRLCEVLLFRDQSYSLLGRRFFLLLPGIRAQTATIPNRTGSVQTDLGGVSALISYTWHIISST